MRLTTFTDFALRVLVYLATHDKRRVTKQDIAAAYDISLHHVAKIVRRLAQEGYVEARRGREGGLRLAAEPAEISLGRVVRDFEEFALVECFRCDENRCPITPACGLIPIFSEAIEAFCAVLDRKTLADIVSNPLQAAAYRSHFLVD